MKNKILELLISLLEEKEEKVTAKGEVKGIPVYTMGVLTGYVAKCS